MSLARRRNGGRGVLGLLPVACTAGAVGTVAAIAHEQARRSDQRRRM